MSDNETPRKKGGGDLFHSECSFLNWMGGTLYIYMFKS